MFMLAYKKRENVVADTKDTEAESKADIPIMGLPGCVMYSKRTIFDLVLPRIVAGEHLSGDDFSVLGEGGLCLNCNVCTYPNCGFGK